MKNLLEKINSGNYKISNDDIVNFITDQINERDLNDYFEGVYIEDAGMSIKKNKATNRYKLITNIDLISRSIENRLFSLPTFKAIYERQIIFFRNRFITKMVSLIYLFLIFHELEHIEHIRTKTTQDGFEASLLKDVSLMLEIVPYFALTIGHDHFPEEVMADVEALRKIDSLIASHQIKVSDSEMILLNQFIAERLYSAYTVENEFYSIDIGEHPAPLDFIDYLAKHRLSMEKNFDFMNHIEELDYSLDDIKYGKRIDNFIIDYLKCLKSGEIFTLNLESDIKKIMMDLQQRKNL